MKNNKLAFVMYKPKEGFESELLTLLNGHLPTLRKLGLAADSQATIARSADGSIIEIFEWVTEDAKEKAHSILEVRAIWNRMMDICDFPSLKDLHEAESSFPNFELIRYI